MGGPVKSQGGSCGCHDSRFTGAGLGTEPLNPATVAGVINLLKLSAPEVQWPKASNCDTGRLESTTGAEVKAGSFIGEVFAGWLLPSSARKRSMSAIWAESSVFGVEGNTSPLKLSDEFGELIRRSAPKEESDPAAEDWLASFKAAKLSASESLLFRENNESDLFWPNGLLSSFDFEPNPEDELLASDDDKSARASSCRFKKRCSGVSSWSLSGSPNIFSGVGTPITSSGVINIQFFRLSTAFCQLGLALMDGMGIVGELPILRAAAGAR